MREFAKYEQVKAKCPVCGCRNKVQTPLYESEDDIGVIIFTDHKGVPRDKKVGYTLKCCNCGHYAKFILDNTTNGESIPDREHLVSGESQCIMLSYCRTGKKCPLYGTCGISDTDVVPKTNETRTPADNTIKRVIEPINPPRFL